MEATELWIVLLLDETFVCLCPPSPWAHTSYFTVYFHFPILHCNWVKFLSSVIICSAMTGALYVALRHTRHFLDIHSAQRQNVTTFAQDCYYSINATTSSYLQLKQQTNTRCKYLWEGFKIPSHGKILLRGPPSPPLGGIFPCLWFLNPLPYEDVWFVAAMPFDNECCNASWAKKDKRKTATTRWGNNLHMSEQIRVGYPNIYVVGGFGLGWVGLGWVGGDPLKYGKYEVGRASHTGSR